MIGASWLASVCRGEIGWIGLGGPEAGLCVLTEEGRYWPPLAASSSNVVVESGQLDSVTVGMSFLHR